MARIYVASSWKNERQPSLVRELRSAGHEVYDYRSPGSGGLDKVVGPDHHRHGFEWGDVDVDWRAWCPADYRAALRHDAAERGFAADLAAMRWAEVCVCLLPCGASAHLEAGWAIGNGLPTYFLIEADGKAAPGSWQPELMYLLGTRVVLGVGELLEEIKGVRKPKPVPVSEESRLAMAAPEMFQAIKDMIAAMRDGGTMGIHRIGLETLVARIEGAREATRATIQMAVQADSYRDIMYGRVTALLANTDDDKVSVGDLIEFVNMDCISDHLIAEVAEVATFDFSDTFSGLTFFKNARQLSGDEIRGELNKLGYEPGPDGYNKFYSRYFSRRRKHHRMVMVGWKGVNV